LVNNRKGFDLRIQELLSWKRGQKEKILTDKSSMFKCREVSDI